MTILKYIGRRLLVLIPVLVGISLAAFCCSPTFLCSFILPDPITLSGSPEPYTE